jgi:hypothetical protein
MRVFEPTYGSYNILQCQFTVRAGFRFDEALSYLRYGALYKSRYSVGNKYDFRLPRGLNWNTIKKYINSEIINL